MMNDYLAPVPFAPLKESSAHFRPRDASADGPDGDGRLVGCFEDADGRNQNPLWLLDHHPLGQLVAMQATVDVHCLTSRAGVWDAASGKLLWQPDNTLALCWLPGGHEVVLIREAYERSLDHPPMLIGPLQSEYTYFFERRTWPGKALISRCVIRPPAGWIDRVVVSPRGDLAAFRWIEQGCAGFELVALTADGDRQTPGAGYRTKPNLLSGPVFSPDGSYIALSCGRWSWWMANLEDYWEYDKDTPSSGGSFEVGHVTIFHVTIPKVEELSHCEMHLVE